MNLYLFKFDLCVTSNEFKLNVSFIFRIIGSSI